MKKLKILCFTIFIISVTFSATGQNIDFKTQIDEYVKTYVKNGDFSGNILIAKDNKILFNQSYGKASYELNVPMQKNYKFRIASVSKTFTAAAIVLCYGNRICCNGRSNYRLSRSACAPQIRRISTTSIKSC